MSQCYNCYCITHCWIDGLNILTCDITIATVDNNTKHGSIQVSCVFNTTPL